MVDYDEIMKPYTAERLTSYAETHAQAVHKFLKANPATDAARIRNLMTELNAKPGQYRRMAIYLDNATEAAANQARSDERRRILETVDDKLDELRGII